MTPQEKAIDFCQKIAYVSFRDEFNDGYTLPLFIVKKCALVAVTEILNANPHSNPFNTDAHSTIEYWQQVKAEIELL